MSQLITRALPHVPYANTHSFRIGGATAAASDGISDSTIQILGRWSSDAYRRYLRFSDTVIQNMSTRMATVGHCTRVWDNDLLASVSSSQQFYR